LSQLPGKNAEDIAAWVNVDRQIIQDFIGIVPWDHQPLIGLLVAQVVYLLAAENVSGPPPCRLSDVNRPVINSQNRFSTPRPRALADI
jgi:hypothetical protein